MVETDSDRENNPSEGSASERDVRPVVQRPRAGLSGVAIGIGVVVAALILFVILDARRRALTAPAALPQAQLSERSASPPPLYIPPEPPPAPRVIRIPETRPTPVPTPSPAPPESQVVYRDALAQQPVPQAPQAPARDLSGPALVLDQGRERPVADSGQGQPASQTPSGGETIDTGRARAARFAGQTTTVSQGTIIPAILETALNSNNAGFARALVQRDIRGFDGAQILIPRGSRLIGQYSGQVMQGQKRVLILWNRLIRPDGTTIALNSPAADPVGRAGVEADVDSHFFARFGGAILNSVLNVGVNLASRTADSPVILALPGSLQGASNAIIQPTEIAPTLKVKPGASISVFVARDLDFGAAERASADR